MFAVVGIGSHNSVNSRINWIAVLRLTASTFQGNKENFYQNKYIILTWSNVTDIVRSSSI